MNVVSIFPTPVASCYLDREFLPAEHEAISDYEETLNKNEGNYTSVANHILDTDKRFAQLKTFIEAKIEEYWDTTISPNTTIDPYITQSWLNYSYTGDYHHVHRHPNSYLSGVFYFKTIQEDSIVFHKSVFDPIFCISSNKPNKYNSNVNIFPVQEKMLILFPSDTVHSVDPIKEENACRISLAFNTFFKGEIGNKDSLNELIL
jgi:uncharacterized protein (TIGR02466 family)